MYVYKQIQFIVYQYKYVIYTYLGLRGLSKEEVHVGRHESCVVLLQELRCIAHISPVSACNPCCLAS